MLNWAEIEAQEEVADIAANLPVYLQHLARDGTWVRYADVNAKGGEVERPCGAHVCTPVQTVNLV